MKINVPNILTILRILLSPLFIILLLKKYFLLALLVFALAGISDGLDGFIARYFNQRTVLGAYLDPIADKLLLTTAFVSLAIIKLVPGWLAVIVISREVLIMLGIAVITITGIHIVIRPSLVSKWTTAFQLAGIGITLLAKEVTISGGIISALYWLIAGLTAASGLHYIYVGLNILQDTLGNRPNH